MRISDWSSDVCSSDLLLQHGTILFSSLRLGVEGRWHSAVALFSAMIDSRRIPKAIAAGGYVEHVQQRQLPDVEGEQQQERTGARIPGSIDASRRLTTRSEEHTSELQSLLRISYAVFCLKKKNQKTKPISTTKH